MGRRRDEKQMGPLQSYSGPRLPRSASGYVTSPGTSIAYSNACPGLMRETPKSCLGQEVRERLPAPIPHDSFYELSYGCTLTIPVAQLLGTVQKRWTPGEVP